MFKLCNNSSGGCGWGSVANTRLVRLGNRKCDGAEQALIELVGSELVKRAADRAKRRQDRLNAMRQGKEDGETPEE